MRSTGMALGGAAAAAGFGLLMWCGITTALLQLRPGGATALSLIQGPGLLLGVLLAAGGSVATHRTRPGRERSRLLGLGAILMAAALAVSLHVGLALRAPNAVGVAGVVLLLLAFGAIAAASVVADRTAPRVRPLQAPIQLLFAMATGLGLLYLLMEQRLGAAGDGRLMLTTLLGLGAVLAVCHVIDGRPGAARHRPAPPVIDRCARRGGARACPPCWSPARCSHCCSVPGCRRWCRWPSRRSRCWPRRCSTGRQQSTPPPRGVRSRPPRPEIPEPESRGRSRLEASSRLGIIEWNRLHEWLS